MQSRTGSVLVLLAVAALISLPQAALAQRDAGAKARGDYSGTFWSTRSATRSVRHAREYATDAHQYVKSTPKPSVEHLKADAKEIGRNIDTAKAELTYLEKNASKDDAKAIASILGHLKAAEAEHARLHACCEGPNVKVDEAMACCDNIAEHLKKAHDELQSLEKKLAPKTPAPKK